MACLATALLSFSLALTAQPRVEIIKDQASLKPFPEAEEGMVRHVISMEEKANEDLFKVEIIPGKVMSVDCNHHFLIGKMEEKNLQGWGYTYYEFITDGNACSTMMACVQPNEDKFVSGETLLVRYNSRLPIVIYTPEGYEVKYRIWEAGEEKIATIE